MEENNVKVEIAPLQLITANVSVPRVRVSSVCREC